LFSLSYQDPDFWIVLLLRWRLSISKERWSAVEHRSQLTVINESTISQKLFEFFAQKRSVADYRLTQFTNKGLNLGFIVSQWSWRMTELSGNQ
jgi:hypothetical protein